MTTQIYIHNPVPPYVRIAGPIKPNDIRRGTGLSINSFAEVTVAAEDVELDWIRAGMCWLIEQNDIGEPPWGGFVEREDIPMGSISIEIPLVGPKKGLLEVEMAVELPARVSGGYAVNEALLAVQATTGAMFAGDIEVIGPSILLNVRGETVSDFIDTVQDNVRADWLERTVVTDNTLEFFLDFGKLQREKPIVLSRNEIITGIFTRNRVISSLTELGEASGFSERDAASVVATLLRPQAADATIHPVSQRTKDMLLERDIGPGATRHAVEISERVSGEQVSSLVQERHEDLLLGVEEIAFVLDGTKAGSRSVQLGDVVTIDVRNWFKDLRVNAIVQIREITPHDDLGQRDVIASVIQ
jgi:hypothetical protein